MIFVFFEVLKRNVVVLSESSYIIEEGKELYPRQSFLPWSFEEHALLLTGLI